MRSLHKTARPPGGLPSSAASPSAPTRHRPYVRLLHDESKDIAGLLSQLPAEVAVEEIAKSIVIVSRGTGGP